MVKQAIVFKEEIEPILKKSGFQLGYHSIVRSIIAYERAEIWFKGSKMVICNYDLDSSLIVNALSYVAYEMKQVTESSFYDKSTEEVLAEISQFVEAGSFTGVRNSA